LIFKGQRKIEKILENKERKIEKNREKKIKKRKKRKKIQKEKKREKKEKKNKRKIEIENEAINSSQRTPVDGKIFTPLPRPTRSATHSGRQWMEEFSPHYRVQPDPPPTADGSGRRKTWCWSKMIKPTQNVVESNMHHEHIIVSTWHNTGFDLLQ
jgi:hypothetical protein